MTKAHTRQLKLEALLKANPVIPVITIEAPEHGVPLAKALMAGGIRAIEITLRTAAAFEAAKEIIANVPEAIVGIGTILSRADLVRAADMGAVYALSPGATPELLEAAAEIGLPFVPGIATASEIMAALARGFDIVKFFPAVPAGGIAMLRSFAGPFPQMRFCPTGGIAETDAPLWLAEPNVIAIGGSWIAPVKDIKAGNWDVIEERARRLSGR